jgi:hypothetical protein
MGSDFRRVFNASVDHPSGHRDHDHSLLTERQVRYAFHTDTDQQCSTRLHYLNTNNGMTVSSDGITVESVD